ncbi:segregation/condensation protein A, partial [Patescibacteria group bacterium]
QKIDDLIKRVEGRILICFSDVNKSKDCEKIDLVVSFLALLELTRRGFIIVKQDKAFGEIKISKNKLC